jgi:hypothetical protein
VTLGSHQVRSRAGFRSDYQVTVVSIGLPTESEPLRRNVLPALEKANRKPGTAPASAARPSVPGQRTSLEIPGVQLPGGVLSLLNLA